MRDLTQHLTTRADDNHAPPVSVSRRTSPISRLCTGCQDLVRFFALLRIKPHTPLLVRAPSSRCFELNHILHCLCGPPSIPLSFNLAAVLPRWITYCVNSGTEGVRPPTPSNHRLRCGLPGYLILFATHTFVPQRQLEPSRPPSPLVFLPISTHFTATPGIPPTSTPLKKNSFNSSLGVKPPDFTTDLLFRLRTLYTQ